MHSSFAILAHTCLGVILAQGAVQDWKNPSYDSSRYGYDRQPSYGYGSDSVYGKSDRYDGYGNDGKRTKDDEKKERGGRYYYGGKYSGECGPDGLYYRDDYSFVICSNKNGYVQPCAPGSQNSGFTDYAPGYYYGYSDFCNKNLVDLGFAAPKYGPGYGDRSAYGYSVDNAGYGADNSIGYDRGSYRSNSYGDDYRRPSYGEPYTGYERRAEEQKGFH